MYSVNFEIKVSIVVDNPFYSCFGDAVVIPGDYGTRREMYCNKSGGLHRLGPFCERFKLSTLDFNSDGLTNGLFSLTGARVQPRPWDTEDLFYPRAANVWDAQIPTSKSQSFSLLVNGNIPLSGVFDLFQDGNVAPIYFFYPDQVGTATFSIKQI